MTETETEDVKVMIASLAVTSVTESVADLNTVLLLLSSEFMAI